jgi:predicted dinucleotide-utilizing enzyme
MDQELIDDFTKELLDLTIKYKIQIAGCGCCGSPYLVLMKNDVEFDMIYITDDPFQDIADNLRLVKSSEVK